MHRALILAIGAVIGLTAPAAAAGLGSAMELEAARANARAGGPVSARDAELLERHGCLSGTRNNFCRRLEGRSAFTEQPRRRWRKRR